MRGERKGQVSGRGDVPSEPPPRAKGTQEPQVWRVVSDQPDALKLIATWPRVGRDVTEKQMAEVVELPVELPLWWSALAAWWSVLTRVFADDIREWWPTLVGNEIILPGGKVDPGIEELMDLTMTLGLKK